VSPNHVLERIAPGKVEIDREDYLAWSSDDDINRLLLDMMHRDQHKMLNDKFIKVLEDQYLKFYENKNDVEGFYKLANTAISEWQNSNTENLRELPSIFEKLMCGGKNLDMSISDDEEEGEKQTWG